MRQDDSHRGTSSGPAALLAVGAASVLLAFAVTHPTAQARNLPPGYSFVGGTPSEHATVKKALAASSFDWRVLPGRVTIHIGPGGACSASEGQIRLGSAMLAHGRAAWGIVQHEFAHQVDFFLLSPAERTTLEKQLGGEAWWAGREGFRHDELGSERFASTLAWSYWPSPYNTLARYAHVEATAMPAARFRRLLNRLLRVPMKNAD
jgi:hypothetical protein